MPSSKAMTAASVQAVILSILSHGDTYGYRIIKKVRDLSDGELDWAAGSLYPVMHRMKTEGLVESYWVQPEGERKRRYYHLTAKGLEALEAEKHQWLTVHNLLVRLWGPLPHLA